MVGSSPYLNLLKLVLDSNTKYLYTKSYLNLKNTDLVQVNWKLSIIVAYSCTNVLECSEIRTLLAFSGENVYFFCRKSFSLDLLDTGIADKLIFF